jgi:hypothetical protein
MTFSSSSFAKNLRPGRVGDDDFFLDLDLPIVEMKSSASGELRIVARGLVEDFDMGFAVVLHPDWDAQTLEGGGATMYWGTGAYERTGPESDYFLEFVARRYQLSFEGLTPMMLASIPAQVVGLDSDPSVAEEHGANMKFFFHSDSEDRYAEVFTNINIEEGFLEFHEKDESYRGPLVRALSEP